MKNIESKLILNIEINNLELVTQLNNLSEELNIELDDLILHAIQKMIYDIKFVRDLRN